jgi:hypothetical protein
MLMRSIEAVSTGVRLDVSTAPIQGPNARKRGGPVPACEEHLPLLLAAQKHRASLHRQGFRLRPLPDSAASRRDGTGRQTRESEAQDEDVGPKNTEARLELSETLATTTPQTESQRSTRDS